MTDGSAYPLTSVLVALELAEPTVTSWAKRGMQGVVIEPSGRGRGRSRTLGWTSVKRLSLIKALTDAGIPVATAANLADQCLIAQQVRPPVETMTVHRYPGRDNTLIAYNGEGVEGVEFTPPWTSLTLHVENVLALTEEALGVPAPVGGVEPASKKPAKSRRAAPPKA